MKKQDKIKAIIDQDLMAMGENFDELLRTYSSMTNNYEMLTIYKHIERLKLDLEKLEHWVRGL